MATVKITITLEESELARVRGLVAARKASSVSGFVQHAVGIALADVDGWAAALEQSLLDTGGPLTGKERTWADGVLGRKKRRGA